MTNAEKNLLIASLEKSLEDAQAGAGVSTSLAEIETDVAALRTAYDTDPATVVAADLVAARDHIQGCVFSSLTANTTEWNAAAAEAAV